MNNTNKSASRSGLFHPVILPIILGTWALIALSSCVTKSDPGADLLKAKINKNPPSDEIVGLWHRENGGDPTTPYSGTFLFKRDGKAYFYRHEFMNKKVENFEYHYQGGGVWELFYIDSFKKKWPSCSASLADQRLIITSNREGSSWLYQRLKN
jgi:hypothetical protein